MAKNIWHVICCGPSALSMLDRDWSGKRVFLVNGMPTIFRSPARELAWVMVDPLLPAMHDWGMAECPYDRYVSRHNSTQVRDGLLLRHSKAVIHEDCLRDGVFWQRSVGHAAVQLARARGAETIYVWGLDYKDRKRSCDEAYSGKPKESPWVMDSIEVGWETVRQGMMDFGVMTWNANPDSGLKALMKVDDAEMAWREEA